MLNRHSLRRPLAIVAFSVLLIAASTPVPQADPSRYISDIRALASPEMEGRGAGTKGIARAEHLIEKRYKELHLDPAGVNGYTQPFPVVTGARLKSDNRCTVQTGDAKNDLKIEQDFVPSVFHHRSRWMRR